MVKFHFLLICSNIIELHSLVPSCVRGNMYTWAPLLPFKRHCAMTRHTVSHAEMRIGWSGWEAEKHTWEILSNGGDMRSIWSFGLIAFCQWICYSMHGLTRHDIWYLKLVATMCQLCASTCSCGRYHMTHLGCINPTMELTNCNPTSTWCRGEVPWRVWIGFAQGNQVWLKLGSWRGLSAWST